MPTSPSSLIAPARKIAFEVLRSVAAEGAYASELLHTRIGARVSRADAALATELTFGVLRWQRLLDFLLSRHLDRQPERLDLEVLLALRIGLYQLRFLDRVPAHAAVSQSVEMVKVGKKHSAAPLVNAVLRRTIPTAKISGDALQKLVPMDTPDAERMAILYSHPTWMVERWMAAFGSDRTRALLEANNRAARLCCTVSDPRGIAAVAAQLKDAGMNVVESQWLQDALTLSGGNPTSLEAFGAGRIGLQDEASQMVAHLVDAQPGHSVLDLCAAPGGKTVLLSRASGGTGRVVAADLHRHRLRSLAEQLARTHSANVSLIELDGTSPLPFSPAQFDRVLVDAPCSGTGTLARNPEIRWRLSAADLPLMHDRQTTMLRNALTALRPGGRLVYSTCSLEPEENEHVVSEALAGSLEFQIVAGQASLKRHLREGKESGALFDAQGFFRTFPPQSQTDGFFGAVIERRDA